ncbi:MAG: YidC/Oxa1 family membrane protein insertase [Patescibacteria group bacterium]|nr:YidC/Oxa1 family membrane protein insertase [Patescibacteria group bacterium]
MVYIWNEFLIKPLLNLLLFLYNNVPGHDLGIAIIIITIIIRVVVLPLSLKSSRAQRKMKKLAPELAILKERHKSDQQAFAKAQMEFYKHNGVSPISSCLPVLIQLPILLALYQIFREVLTKINPAQVYSFIHLPEKISPTFLGFLDLSKPEKFVLPVLAAGLQYVLAIMTTPIDKSKNPSTEQKMNRQMIFLMPLMTLFFAVSLPSGLTLYWVVGTLFSIGQQVIVDREKNKEVVVRVKKAGGEEIIVVEEKRD